MLFLDRFRDKGGPAGIPSPRSLLKTRNCGPTVSRRLQTISTARACSSAATHRLYVGLHAILRSRVHHSKIMRYDHHRARKRADGTLSSVRGCMASNCPTGTSTLINIDPKATTNCCGEPGSLGYEDVDMEFFAKVGCDHVMVDWCRSYTNPYDTKVRLTA